MHADKGLSFVSGKADDVLLSFVLGYFIHIACNFKDVSTNPFVLPISQSVASSAINWARIIVHTNPSTTR
jgi:hypothetical protein